MLTTTSDVDPVIRLSRGLASKNGTRCPDILQAFPLTRQHDRFFKRRVLNNEDFDHKMARYQ